jgi:LETM1 and EF-hand domain-containing protein 1
MKKKLQARLQYARFLQETVGEMAREVKSSSTGDKKKTAEDLVAFMQKVGGPEL